MGQSSSVSESARSAGRSGAYTQNLRTENDRQAINSTLLAEIQTLRAENYRQASEITSMKQKQYLTKRDSDEKDSTIIQLRTRLVTLQKQFEMLKQGTNGQGILSSPTREEMLIRQVTGGSLSIAFQQKMRLAQAAKQAVKMTTGTQTDQDDITFSEDYPVSTASFHRTPDIHISQVTYRWYNTLIVRSPGAEPPGRSREAEISMVNLEAGVFCSEDIVKPKLATTMRFGEKVYYHGTDVDSAKSILQYGIDVTKSVRNVDFSRGRGFYLTDNFERAVDWSERVAGWRNSQGAIIAFKISKSLRKERHLSLKVDNVTNRKWWECIVSHFRHGETSPDVTIVLRDVKFIKGPVAINKFLGRKELPTPYDFSQVCIRNQDYARRFGSLQNICFVIFFV